MLKPRECLSRASEHLASDDRIRLFYAALELRLGVEARLHDYRDAAERAATLKRRGWKIADLAKDLDRVFRTGDKGVVFRVYAEEREGHYKAFIFTPVRRQTRQLAERLGDYLHFTSRTRINDDEWVQEFRDVLKGVATGLAFATTGMLLAPPLVTSGNGKKKITAITEVSGDAEAGEVLAVIGGVGGKVRIDVKYFDELPMASAG